MPAISRRNGMDPDIFEVFAAQQDRCVRDRLIPAEAEVVETDAVPPAILDEMRAMGLFGITVPVSHGGAGLNGSQYVQTIRRLADAAPACRSAISIGSGMVASALKNGGTAAQKAEWLPRLAAGAIASFGLTEPGSGSGSAALQTRALRADTGYVLKGTMRQITSAPIADIIQAINDEGAAGWLTTWQSGPGRTGRRSPSTRNFRSTRLR